MAILLPNSFGPQCNAQPSPRVAAPLGTKKEIATMRGWAADGLIALTLATCEQTTGERAVSGTGIGALGGAALGAATNGSVLGGAAIGGVAGGATGVLTSPRQVDLNRR
jgi:osmotically inducible lipoprotein OsmB